MYQGNKSSEIANSFFTTFLGLHMDFLQTGISSIKDALHSKVYIKIGDAIANLIYSLAKAKYSKEILGKLEIKGSPKVSAKVLKDSLEDIDELEELGIKVKGDAHAIADGAEAILAYAWVTEIITLDEAVELVAGPVINAQPVKKREEWDAFSEGFRKVFKKITSFLGKTKTE